MSRYWRSKETGITYDTTQSDRHGNWLVVGAPSLLPSLSSMTLAIGAIGALASWIIVVITSLPLAMALYFARWPFVPMLLTLVALLLLVLPQGRRHWKATLTAAGLSLVMIPGSIASIWALNDSAGQIYAWVASFPLVTIVSLGMAVWAGIRRLWPAMGLYTVMFAVSGLINLLAWADSLIQGQSRAQVPGMGPQPPASSYGVENILGTATLVVVTLMIGIIAAQIADSAGKQRASVPSPGPQYPQGGIG